MTLSRLVFRSMLKNMKHYYLYFFALIFSVTLYFSFLTLQYNKTVLETTVISGSATAGFNAASYLLYFIIAFFVLYANHLFMKRRSKEIGMYQLIGMTKGLVVRLITIENIVLFIGAVFIGIVLGFISSRLFTMILFRLIGQEVIVAFTLSVEAITRSVIVFTVLLIVILVQTMWMIRRMSLLSLFNSAKQADERVKRFSTIQMVIGAMGLVMIGSGYYVSSSLFTSNGDIYLKMILILVLTIGGTFLVFRFSIAFVMNVIRGKKNGQLSVVDVLAVTPIMHRMKGNAKSLTLITILTAVSLAITTLSYIAYYSADVTAYQQVPADYILQDDDMDSFLNALEQEGINYEMTQYAVDFVEVPIKELLPIAPSNIYANMAVIPLSDYQQIQPDARLQGNDAIIESHYGYMAELYPIELGIELTVQLGTYDNYVQDKVLIKDVRDEPILGFAIKGGGGLILVVSDELFANYAQYDSALQPNVQKSIVLNDKSNIARTEVLYDQYEYTEQGDHRTYFGTPTNEEVRKDTIGSLGVTIFVTAFLGLAFLVATGSILYFKQIAEADDERASYEILRKIGFSQQQLLQGIIVKQIFNFGVPLLIGLLHSYFAVKSGWFLFGSVLLTPMLITMTLYVFMYMVFAVLSVHYYKKVIKESL